MSRQINSVGVIGLGTMGAGIVEVFARGGIGVVAVETTEELAERGRSILQGSTDRAVAKGKLDEAGQAGMLGRVSVTTDMQDLADVDLVVEAVPEVLDIKRSVFTTLDGIVREDAILATNTSSLSITDIATATGHPHRVVGMHFFNPAPVLKLVEVVTTLVTDAAVVESVRGLAEGLGKKPIVVRDRAGFVANYLLFGYLNRSMGMLERGQVGREDLDTAMRVGAGLPMGPLTLMDLIGLDVCNDIGDVIFDFSRSPMHAPSSMLNQMVTTGMLGRKSGRGFYTYDKPGGSAVVEDGSTPTAPEVVRSVRTVGVIGSGEIAAVLRQRLERAGYAVTPVENSNASLEPLAGVDLVVEAADDPGADEPDPADLADLTGPAGTSVGGRDIDRLFTELGDVVADGTILATTNTYSAAALAAVAGRPEDVVVLRVHTPTGNGQVVEIGRSSATAGDVVAAMRELVTRIEASPVVSQDRPGLVVDSLLTTHLNDAVRMHEVGYASIGDIDTAMKFGTGYPMGPFEMIDALGPGEVLAVQEELFTGGAGVEADLAPATLLIEHVLLDRPFTSA